MSKKIVTIVGARPQFVKASVVSHAISQITELEEVIIHTGQHYDKNMSDVFFDELMIPKPKYFLGIGSASHGAQTGRMLEGIENIIKQESPDITLVYGDTNSTLAGALASSKLHIPVAHVEAGLRSFNKRMPEEINRILTDHVSDFLFTPTKNAKTNLINESIDENKIFEVGDVMYDVALKYSAISELRSNILVETGLFDEKFILFTIHRAENTDDFNRLNTIVEVIIKLSETNLIVFPLHPRTQVALESFNLLNKIEKIVKVIPPVSYIDMIMLEKSSELIVTDSGGVQKEAFFFKKPCVTLRNETEWSELVDLGCNRIIPLFTIDNIVESISSKFYCDFETYSPYGNGKSSIEIAQLLRK